MTLPLTVSAAFLNNLKSLFSGVPNFDGGRSGAVTSARGYPAEAESPVFQNPWYIIAAVAFSASNRPEGIKCVFDHVLQDLGHHHEEEDLKRESKRLAQKLREALFKSGLVSGYPKAINSLQALHVAIPDDWKETMIQRDTNVSLADYETKGLTVFRSIYGETADSVDGLLTSIYPDMGWFSRTIGYGLVYGHVDTLSTLETSYTLVAALIAGDTPQQIGWHLDGAKRGGASTEEVRAVRQISIEVAKFSGIQWKHDVPEVN